MNSPIEPNQAPTQNIDADAEASDLAQTEAELAADAPQTVSLKRGDTPLFLPVTLPDPTPEAETGSSFGENLASASQASTAPDAPAPTEIPTQQPAEVPIEVPAEVSPPPQPENPLLAVEFSPPPHALHSASVTLQLRCALPGATIRYALDAEEVDENGALYDPASKILLTQSTKIAARAWHGEEGGPVAVAHFEIARPQWQKVEPTDQSDPTTHEAHDEAILEGPWRLAAASVRGKLHAHRGGWREDAFRHGVAHAVDGTYSVVVVSDGAGSAPLSRVGSNLLCQTALDYLISTLGQSAPLSADAKTLAERDLPPLRSVLVESARLALQTLRDEAARRNRPLSDFAATFLVLVRREWNGAQLCAALQAGDGGIALWNQDDSLTILGEADHGAQSGETRFLISSGMEAELPARVKFSIRPNLHAVAVFTDGISDDYFPETERYPDLFRTVLPLVEGQNALSPGAALLDWIDYDKKGSADDRALVLCWRAQTRDENTSPPNPQVSTSVVEVQTPVANTQASVASTQTPGVDMQTPVASTQTPGVDMQAHDQTLKMERNHGA